MHGFQLSEEAQKDLKEISHYTRKNWGNKQAKHYLIELASGFEKLARSPKLGRVRKEIEKDLRSFSIAHHIIFYRIGKECIDIIQHNCITGKTLQVSQMRIL